jgi:hypothetical protein
MSTEVTVSSNRLTRTALGLALAVALAVLGAAPASAATNVRTFRPVAVQGGAMLFRVKAVAPERVTRVRLALGSKTYTVRADVVRTALRRKRLVRARLAVAVSARVRKVSARRRARLLVYVKAAKQTTPAKKPSTSAATTTKTAAGTTTGTKTARSPVTAGCGVGWGAFASPVAIPGACWRPYSDASPFNQELPANPRLAGNSASIVNTVTGWGSGPADLPAGTTQSSGDWNHPAYYSSPADPVFTVHCTESWGTCEVEGMQVHIPDAARAASSSDAHLAVVDQAGGWEYDLWAVKSKPAGGGTITIGWGGRTRIGTDDADGLGSDATAAHFGLLAGVVREPEMRAGQINHALFMVVKCDSGQKVFPAEGKGSPCAGGAADAPHEGSRFQLAMSDEQIAAMNVPQWKKTILTAMAHYGMFVGDTGGSPWEIEFESGATYTSFGMPDPWVDFFDEQPDVSRDGKYRYLSLASDVEWKKYLRVVDPCVSQRTC